MSTRTELMQKLRNADAVGDSYAAKRFATMIREQDKPKLVADTTTPVADVDFDFGTMVENIPSSGKKTAVDIFNAIRHPIDTGKAIGNVAVGAVQKLIPGEQESEKYADAVGQFVMDRYGSENAFKTTLMEDPVGVLGDFAGVLSAGSLAIPKYGSKIAKVVGAIDPVNIATSGVAKTVMNIPGIKNAPSNLYKSAAKFGKKFDGDAVTDTALRERILPTDVGIEKGKEILSGLSQQIDDVITQSVDSGKRIPRTKLYQHLKKARQDLGGVNLDAADNLKKLNKVVSSFEEHIKGKGKASLTAAEVQNFKTKIYESINWKAKQGKGSQAKNVTRKAIARGAKDELEKAIPEIKGINLQIGEMMELMDAIDAPAARIANRDLIGIGMPSKVITGSLVGDSSGAGIGYLLGLIDTPSVKSKLAIGLNDIKKQSVSNARKRVLTIELLRNAGKAAQEEQLTE